MIINEYIASEHQGLSSTRYIMGSMPKKPDPFVIKNKAGSNLSKYIVSPSKRQGQPTPIHIQILETDRILLSVQEVLTHFM